MAGKTKKDEERGPGGSNLDAISRQYTQRAEQATQVEEQAAKEREERDKNLTSSTVQPDYPSDEPVTETKPGPEGDGDDKDDS